MSKNRKCANCKEYIEVDPSEDYGVSFFCSFECRYEKIAQKKPRKAIKRKPRRSGNMSSELRRKVCARDHFRCRGCMKKTNDEVHHIKYRSEGGKDDVRNLVLLCMTCHDEVHSSKKKFQPALLEMTDYITNTKNQFDMTYWEFIEED